MAKKSGFKFEEIGYWSEIKLEIIKAYAQEYSKIISAQKTKLHHVYIDAFAGAGVHKSKTKGELVPGSPLNALSIDPPFEEYYFIDLVPAKTENLKDIVQQCFGNIPPNVHIYEGDCNSILLNEVFPKVQFRQFRRGLCLLDPYGLHLNWDVIKTAGAMKSIEIFLNFPILDINRNVIWHNPKGVASEDIERMNAYWGDESWRSIAYTTRKDLFEFEEKEDSKVVAEYFKKRLNEVAEFSFVAPPLPMRNLRKAIIYYLYFASQKPVSKKSYIIACENFSYSNKNLDVSGLLRIVFNNYTVFQT